VTLLADVNRLVYQEDVVSNWQPAQSLVEDAVPGAKISKEGGTTLEVTDATD